MDISIIIVSWNVSEKLRENLKSIFESETKYKFEVFVVDNNSKDNSVEMVRKEFPQVKLIKNKENLGFARANNQAFKQVKGRFILLLNPDMKLKKDTIDNILNWAEENKQADVIGCKLEDEKGKNVAHVRKFPKLLDQLAIILKLPHILPSVLNSYLYKDFDYSKEAQVDSIRGSFFLIKKDSFEKYFLKERVKKNELLDERYFIWFEEVDFCKELKEAGGQVWYTPSVTAIDYVAGSFSQVGSLKKQKYFRDSMIKYFKKWHSCFQVLILEIFWLIAILFAKILFKNNQ